MNCPGKSAPSPGMIRSPSASSAKPKISYSANAKGVTTKPLRKSIQARKTGDNAAYWQQQADYIYDCKNANEGSPILLLAN
jgi:hypothetical protein